MIRSTILFVFFFLFVSFVVQAAAQEASPAKQLFDEAKALQKEGTADSVKKALGKYTEALNHYRRAFDALNKGDWRTFGVEMDAMQKALQAPPAKR